MQDKEPGQLTELEETLECSVCLNRCNKPRTLPCLHTFCLACIDQEIRHVSGRKLEHVSGTKDEHSSGTKDEHSSETKDEHSSGTKDEHTSGTSFNCPICRDNNQIINKHTVSAPVKSPTIP